MALDAVCLTAVLEELRKTLVGGKIDKIYQPSREEILLAVRGAGENVKLLLSASPNGPRLHLTREVRENPAQPPMFCMLLRKHLTGGRILALEQPHLERIVLIRMETIDELGDRVPRTLVLEAMGRRANLILLDAEGRILDCVRRVEGDVTTGQRAVMPGMFYRLPEPKPGLPPLLDRELEFRSGGESRGESLEEKLERLRRIVETDHGFLPYLLVRYGKAVDFTFLPILQYGPGTESRRRESFSQLLDEFYAGRAASEKVGQRGQELQKAVKRLRERVARRVGQQEIELSFMRPKAEYFDALVDANLLTSLRETAKLLHTGEKALVRYLLEHRYLYRGQTGKLLPYATRSDGLFEVKEAYDPRSGWRGTQTYVTPRGRETLRLLMLGEGPSKLWGAPQGEPRALTEKEKAECETYSRRQARREREKGKG